MIHEYYNLEYPGLRTFGLGTEPFWLASEASSALGWAPGYLSEHVRRGFRTSIEVGRDFIVVQGPDLAPWKDADIVEPRVGRLMLLKRSGLWLLAVHAKNLEIATWLATIVDPVWRAGMPRSADPARVPALGLACSELHAEMESCARLMTLRSPGREGVRSGKPLEEATKRMGDVAYEYVHALADLRRTQGVIADPEDSKEWGLEPWISTREGDKMDPETNTGGVE